LGQNRKSAATTINVSFEPESGHDDDRRFIKKVITTAPLGASTSARPHPWQKHGLPPRKKSNLKYGDQQPPIR